MSKKGVILLVICAVIAIIIVNDVQAHGSGRFQNLSLIFIALILETFPFLLLGIIISSLVRVFVPKKVFLRIFGRHKFWGLLAGGMLGIPLPICSCGTIPLARSLIKKGVPPYIGIMAILAIPIVNPITFLSTLVAFRFQAGMAFLRLGLGFGVALVTCLLLSFFIKSSEDILLDSAESSSADICEHPTENISSWSRKAKVWFSLQEMSEEFFEIGKFVIIGAFLAAFLQSFLPQDALLAIGQGRISALFTMLILGFALSLCSTADAFIAASFASVFSPASLLIFMVVGPTVSLKNIIIMYGVFKTKAVNAIIGLTVAVLLLFGLIGVFLL